MFERMTDRARRVLVLAQDEARFLHHSYIGTEHILLGLLSEGEGVGYLALVRKGISSETAREGVREIIGEGVEAASGHIPFTPRAKKIFELSLREAIRLGHNYIGTEHILLALVREGEGVGAQVLARMGLKLAPLREAVLDLIKDHPEHREATQRPWPRMERTTLCLHQPEGFRYRPIEIDGEDNQPSMTAILVTCSNCRATIGVLPSSKSA